MGYKNESSDLELIPPTDAEKYDAGAVVEKKNSLFKTQGIVLTIVICILLVGNAALFIWSNTR